MYAGKDIILVVDYHAENIEFLWHDALSGEEKTGTRPTSRTAILQLVAAARRQAGPDRGVIWIMESTTGWARVKQLLGPQVQFILTNVLQMPLPPKAYRRKTDKIDARRILREFLHGSLPESFQPEADLRQVRRLVDVRQELVERQTAVKNWITSLMHHERWDSRAGLWSAKGRARLWQLEWPAADRLVLKLKLEQLDYLGEQLALLEGEMRQVAARWPQVQWLDEIYGIGLITALTLLAHIGPIGRFASANALIAYVGLAPGLRQSDQTTHHGSIGGGGTDRLLRYFLIEATTWLCRIPRYQPAYRRVLGRRGKNIARIVIARMVLRSIYKMLRDQIRFEPQAAVPNGKKRKVS
jgi:transposase